MSQQAAIPEQQRQHRADQGKANQPADGARDEVEHGRKGHLSKSFAFTPKAAAIFSSVPSVMPDPVAPRSMLLQCCRTAMPAFLAASPCESPFFSRNRFIFAMSSMGESYSGVRRVQQNCCGPD